MNSSQSHIGRTTNKNRHYILAGTPTVNEKVAVPIQGDYSEEDLDLVELREMAEDIEEPGEVTDLYHKYPPDLTPCTQTTTQKRAGIRITTGTTTKEMTPTKSADGVTTTSTPRRSPRLQEQQNTVINIIKVNTKDLKGVDPRLDVPKVLVLAHRDTSSGQDVDDLRMMLQDLSDKRLKMQFDLCE